MRRTMKCLALALAVLTMLWGAPRGESAGKEQGGKKIAVIVVRLPAEAELFIGGMKSTQRSAVREFDTPPLTPGQYFSYPLKAVWKDGAKVVKREATIIVQAGKTTKVNVRELKPLRPRMETVSAK